MSINYRIYLPSSQSFVMFHSTSDEHATVVSCFNYCEAMLMPLEIMQKSQQNITLSSVTYTLPCHMISHSDRTDCTIGQIGINMKLQSTKDS